MLLVSGLISINYLDLMFYRLFALQKYATFNISNITFHFKIESIFKVEFLKSVSKIFLLASSFTNMTFNLFQKEETGWIKWMENGWKTEEKKGWKMDGKSKWIIAFTIVILVAWWFSNSKNRM